MNKTNNIHLKRCLLIIPKHFYSFQKQFRLELEKRGYEVIIANDEYPENIWGLLLGKLKIPFVKTITYNRFKEDYLKVNYDLVLIFKGRGISNILIHELKTVSKRVIGYNWDSFRFNSTPLGWYNLVDKYATFDVKDAEDFNISLIELFTTIEDDYKVNDFKQYKFSAIFRNHSNRIKYLHRFMKRFHLTDNEIYIYIYEKNIFFKILNFINSPLLYIKYRNHIFSESMKYTDYLDIISKSHYTLDYAHPKQTGLTMRCFDSLNMKTRIVTNNKYIYQSPYFKNTNPVFYNTNTDKFIGEFMFDEKLMNTKRRTITDFFNDLLS